jgi:hypothetical protein
MSILKAFFLLLWQFAKVSWPALVFSLLAAIGVGFVTYTGLDLLLDNLESQIQTSLGSLPSATLQIMAIAGIDEGIKIILSAYATRFAIAGFFNGIRSRFNLANPVV